MSSVSIISVWLSPAAAVADGDAVQAADGEDTQGQTKDDNVKHFWLCGRNKNSSLGKKTLKYHELHGDSTVK